MQSMIYPNNKPNKQTHKQSDVLRKTTHSNQDESLRSADLLSIFLFDKLIQEDSVLSDREEFPYKEDV